LHQTHFKEYNKFCLADQRWAMVEAIWKC